MPDWKKLGNRLAAAASREKEKNSQILNVNKTEK